MNYEERFEITSVEVWYKLPTEEEWISMTTCRSFEDAVNWIVREKKNDDIFNFNYDYQVRITSMINP